VEWLQTAFPRLETEREGRFDGLKESTIRSWFDSNHRLLPRFQKLLDEEKQTASRGPGNSRMLSSHPGVEDEIKRVLTKMRSEAGAVVKRIAVNMQLYKVHPSLIINMDQTGAHLVPADTHNSIQQEPRMSRSLGEKTSARSPCAWARR
jgi:hypothetical protein